MGSKIFGLVLVLICTNTLSDSFSLQSRSKLVTITTKDENEISKIDSSKNFNKTNGISKRNADKIETEAETHQKTSERRKKRAIAGIDVRRDDGKIVLNNDVEHYFLDYNNYDNAYARDIVKTLTPVDEDIVDNELSKIKYPSMALPKVEHTEVGIENVENPYYTQQKDSVPDKAQLTGKQTQEKTSVNIKELADDDDSDDEDETESKNSTEKKVTPALNQTNSSLNDTDLTTSENTTRNVIVTKKNNGIKLGDFSDIVDDENKKLAEETIEEFNNSEFGPSNINKTSANDMKSTDQSLIYGVETYNEKVKSQTSENEMIHNNNALNNKTENSQFEQSRENKTLETSKSNANSAEKNCQQGFEKYNEQVKSQTSENKMIHNNNTLNNKTENSQFEQSRENKTLETSKSNANSAEKNFPQGFEKDHEQVKSQTSENKLNKTNFTVTDKKLNTSQSSMLKSDILVSKINNNIMTSIKSDMVESNSSDIKVKEIIQPITKNQSIPVDVNKTKQSIYVLPKNHSYEVTSKMTINMVDKTSPSETAYGSAKNQEEESETFEVKDGQDKFSNENATLLSDNEAKENILSAPIDTEVPEVYTLQNETQDFDDNKNAYHFKSEGEEGADSQTESRVSSSVDEEKGQSQIEVDVTMEGNQVFNDQQNQVKKDNETLDIMESQAPSMNLLTEKQDPKIDQMELLEEARQTFKENLIDQDNSMFESTDIPAGQTKAEDQNDQTKSDNETVGITEPQDRSVDQESGGINQIEKDNASIDISNTSEKQKQTDQLPNTTLQDNNETDRQNSEIKETKVVEAVNAPQTAIVKKHGFKPLPPVQPETDQPKEQIYHFEMPEQPNKSFKAFKEGRLVGNNTTFSKTQNTIFQSKVLDQASNKTNTSSVEKSQVENKIANHQNGQKFDSVVTPKTNGSHKFTAERKQAFQKPLNKTSRYIQRVERYRGYKRILKTLRAETKRIQPYDYLYDKKKMLLKTKK